MAKRKLWTEEDDNYLRSNYSDTDSKLLMAYLDCTYSSLMGRVFLLGLKKSKAYKSALVSDKMIEAGVKTRFKKGNKSWNKDTKGLTGANRTSFKQNNRPHNWKPIGSERETKDGYIEVKYKDERKAKSNYELKQRLIWIEHNGPIEKGYVVVFKDGDTRNFDIENLELLSKGENMLRNQLKDSSIAKKYFGGDDASLEGMQELIKLKRAEILLNRKIRDYESNRD